MDAHALLPLPAACHLPAGRVSHAFTWRTLPALPVPLCRATTTPLPAAHARAHLRAIPPPAPPATPPLRIPLRTAPANNALPRYAGAAARAALCRNATATGKRAWRVNAARAGALRA